MRERETAGHSLRVVDLTLQLARSLGMKGDQLQHVRRGALLHDIGKMGIPDSILLKPSTLSEDEWVVMRQHPLYANELLKPIYYLEAALDIPYSHHERWNGEGYPRKLKGEEIPLAARIFAVVDVFDALTSDRPYRPAWTLDAALSVYPRTIRQAVRSKCGGCLLQLHCRQSRSGIIFPARNHMINWSGYDGSSFYF